MRQIVLDTETTGLDPSSGHRIIEIGCIELIDRRPTDNVFHCYLNPQRKVEKGALAVHGIDDDFLLDKPTFASIADEFLKFIIDCDVIIHNAAFDVSFIDAELRLADKKYKPFASYCTVIDTLMLARRLYPGQRNSLDALCNRLEIDNSQRDLHGALLDARLLASVYLHLTGGQISLFSLQEKQSLQTHNEKLPINNTTTSANFNLIVQHANNTELQQHNDYLQTIAKKSGDQCVWLTSD